MSLYKDSGVNIEEGDNVLHFLKREEKEEKRVLSTYGQYAGVFQDQGNRYLVGSADGVGTKVLLAHELEIYETLGQDLLAMNLNDIICVGARPLFFLDTFAAGSINSHIVSRFLKGLMDVLGEHHIPLLGGETAEMPGVYQEGAFDVMGTLVGEVHKEHYLDGGKVRKGDALIGVSSSGFHSNGFTLIRKLISDFSVEDKKKFLTPTKIYYPLVQKLQEELGPSLHAMAHITGGGIDNLSRLSSGHKAVMTSWPELSELPEVFSLLLEKIGHSSQEDLRKTFNMGVGFVLCVDLSAKDDFIEMIESMGEKAWEIGHMEEKGNTDGLH